ncbi:putative nuclease HARBI1 [Patiria miniata]|uniref:DDE Tnp4 domain-containing protein n=1 Tax=Patiria miniata TaxID=46514 RepID=A0A914APP4_PATMI|nr:putative nuclease HARBI1 [Patiria miniata]
MERHWEKRNMYVNRKGYHSINVQANYKLTSVVARWPGSTHDSAIIHGSILGERFTNGHAMFTTVGDKSLLKADIAPFILLLLRCNNCALLYCRLTGVLIGDKGYALRPWLMTPILKLATNAERRYNRSHRKSRVVLEQTFGQLKEWLLRGHVSLKKVIDSDMLGTIPGLLDDNTSSHTNM